MIKQSQISTLAAELQNELKNILNYWITRTVDNTNGGFYGQIKGNSTVVPDANKGVILNARILWTFSASYRILKDPVYKEMAVRAKNYLLEYFIDKDYGGVYWSLNSKGKPIETKKQIYAQAFAIYALSEYYRIEQDPEVLLQAIQLFNYIEKYSFDRQLSGYFEAYSREWIMLDDLRLSDKDANEKKTMNTHLHVLEAYTNLYRIWPHIELKKQIISLINTFLHKIIDQKKASFNLFFEEDWKLKSHETSYGHDIEGSWLLYEAAHVIGDTSIINEVEKIAIRMAEQVRNNGIDTDGGLFNEGHGNQIIDTDKHWWPQAEAIVGFINTYELTKDEKYIGLAQKVWDFTNRVIIDHKEGEWFFRVDKSGKPYKDEDKVGFWKCPYHNSRACMEIIERSNK